MLDQQYQRERELFAACLDLSPDERARFLDQSCPEPALRERVIQLLAAHDRAADATITSGGSPASPAQMPERIGPYRILRPIGEGGMGAVYAAEQLEPIRRSVAVKVIKLGMDTRQVVARFHAERQALAVMDHPYIAKVLDAGATPEGRPYFVMELVDGTPLLEWAEREDPSIRSRVALFIDICQAIQHAHQKGVIHRDLKPSNVLVCGEGESSSPRVIDFGIAKAVEGDLAEMTALTVAAHAIGTPAYMSPEQAAPGTVDIDTRTDIYSLGVVLFQLLTGALPHEPRTATPGEFVVKLGRRELEPPKPSALTPAIPDDLDWIVMKAMAPDRDRRYETAVALADDLHRFLDDEPVVARPPTTTYRLRKFVRRRRGEVLAGAFGVLALVAGLVGTSLGLVRATRAEQEARRQAERAIQVSSFLTDLFENADPAQARGAEITARELLARGAGRIHNDLVTEPEVQAPMLATLAKVHISLGLYREARDLAQRAVTLDPDSREGWLQLGTARQRLGLYDEARTAFQRALSAARKKDGARSLGAAEVLDSLAGLEWQLSRFPQALELHQQALAVKQEVAGPDSIEAARSLRGIGIVKADMRQHQEALDLFSRSLATMERVHGRLHPQAADNLDSMGLSLDVLNRLKEARQCHEEALAIREKVLGKDHPVIAFSLLNLARLSAKEGRLRQAIPLYERGIELRRKTFGPNHPGVADFSESLAIVYARLGDLKNARPLFEQSLAIYQQAYGPNHIETLESHRNYAILCTMEGRKEEAVRHLRAAIENGYEKDIHLEEEVFDPLRPLPSFQAIAK